MKFRIAIATLAFFLFTGTQTFAQQHKMTKEQKTEMKAEREAFKTSLNLSQDQATKFDEISKRYGKQLHEFRGSEIAKEDKKAQGKAIKADLDSEMRALLNDEQYRTYEAHVEQRKREMKGKRGI